MTVAATKKASNTSTSLPDPLDAALASIDPKFRRRIIETYRELKEAFRRNDHAGCGLRSGHLCELVLRALQMHLQGTSTPLGTKVNLYDECLKLERLPATSGPETLRVIVPRALAFLYTFRNKRDIGHVGGDVDANAIDSSTTCRLADWVVCELIRVFHGISLEEAQEIITAISAREIPVVWQVNGRRRVLRPKGLSFADKTLILLYVEAGPVAEEDLVDWLEYSNASVYRRDVLVALHKRRLIEYDRETRTAFLSPLGTSDVESRLAQHLVA
ncbi:MAG: hypothetical protein EPO16_08125 [Dehalococcoidia bacterium]|nr:MAG: hypothetical protein EPO16_08125 [Dehalococcoidia bacterium]